jgi:hypothetical protein
MPVNDGKIRTMIASALDNIGNGDACCGKVEVGFRNLQAARRVRGASLDLELAAAEHYMFARFMVCTGTVSAMQMRALVIGYDIKKWIDRARGNPNAAATTGNPVSPPNKHVVRWGLKGVVDGQTDHDRCNKDASPPLWRSLEEVFGPGRGIGPY